MTIGIVLGRDPRGHASVAEVDCSRSTAWTYTWFFRGTPVLVQLLFWFNITALYQARSRSASRSSRHVPAFSTSSRSSRPSTRPRSALGLNEAAYMSEIARAGLLAVDEGQIEAATSIGMTRGQSLRLVVLPQAMRVIIPPTGQRGHLDVEDHVAGERNRRDRTAGRGHEYLAANYQMMALLIVGESRGT